VAQIGQASGAAFPERGRQKANEEPLALIEG
jgi:hypothetical protein